MAAAAEEGSRDVDANLAARRLCRSRSRTMGGMDNFWLAAAWSLLPTVGVSIVFFIVLRGILRFDRTERKVHAKIEAEERAARGLPPRA